jgi:gliding motility-associated-like protein
MFKPTAFVPDGLNNVFRPVGVFVDDVNPGSYSMKVFNRWGEQIFETNKFTEGWNGQVNGKVAQEGVYIYYIEFMGRNGLPYSQKGTVTLLR